MASYPPGWQSRMTGQSPIEVLWLYIINSYLIDSYLVEAFQLLCEIAKLSWYNIEHVASMMGAATIVTFIASHYRWTFSIRPEVRAFVPP